MAGFPRHDYTVDIQPTQHTAVWVVCPPPSIYAYPLKEQQVPFKDDIEPNANPDKPDLTIEY